ncbi:hypothetical protein GDO78_017640 [Eleutherodactylus coqui]|uniref:Secreted protein n=1 Tax=Eleutherodactylus coqui TaxID=57060 RepID=A0A8J6EKA2_ELECQ|nr:hypothetical protein GDO78_017640 [Eleutherodactylus coqui]
MKSFPIILLIAASALPSLVRSQDMCCQKEGCPGCRCRAKKVSLEGFETLRKPENGYCGYSETQPKTSEDAPDHTTGTPGTSEDTMNYSPGEPGTDEPELINEPAGFPSMDCNLCKIRYC